MWGFPIIRANENNVKKTLEVVDDYLMKGNKQMKNITTKQFQILTDMQLVWDFMVDTYEHFFINGAPAPFFEYAITSSWMNKSYLHLNRLWLDRGKVVGFVFTAEPVTSIFFNLRPGYEELAEDMVVYAEKNMPNFRNEQELVLFRGQSVFVDTVRKKGYVTAAENIDLICDFKKTALNYPLPEGFRFVDPQNCDPVKLAVCTWKGFNHEDKGTFKDWKNEDQGALWNPAKAYNGTLSSFIAPPPHATQQYNIIIENEEGVYVCFSGMWWVPQNKLAYMEPLCTIPEYRRKGLAASALAKHYSNLKPLGAEVMTGGGDIFYSKIGYEDGIHWLHFRKK